MNFRGSILNTVLMTRRTVLLPAATTDLPTLLALWNDSGVRELLFEGVAVSAERACRLLDAGLAQSEAGLGWWLVYPWNNGPALGCVGLLPSAASARAFNPPGNAVQVMPAFSPEAWALGHAHEAMTELVQHAVHGLCLPRLSVLSGAPDPMFDGLLRTLGFQVRMEADTGRRRLRLHEWVHTPPPFPAHVAQVQDRPPGAVAKWSA
jgi:RimJ/RimL family protein N-acetyltransferase